MGKPTILDTPIYGNPHTRMCVCVHVYMWYSLECHVAVGMPQEIGVYVASTRRLELTSQIGTTKTAADFSRTPFETLPPGSWSHVLERGQPGHQKVFCLKRWVIVPREYRDF